MKIVDLFSGIGGISIGLEAAGMETVAFCEIEDYPVKVLNRHWPDVPVSRDVTKLTYDLSTRELKHDGQTIYSGSVDILCGGFPCQDLSVAGKQEGITAERSGLWSECARLIGEIRPRYALFENVTNLLNGGGGDWFKRVLGDISAFGYDAEWYCIPASYVGAVHRRDRVWILAYPSEGSCEGSIKQKMERIAGEPRKLGGSLARWSGRWELPEPRTIRADDGIPNYIHRIAALGNSVVPQIPEIIGRAIMEELDSE